MLAFADIGKSAAVVGLGAAGIQRDGLVKVTDCPLVFFFCTVRDPPIVVGLGIRGVQLNSLVEVADGSVIVVLAQVH